MFKGVIKQIDDHMEEYLMAIFLIIMTVVMLIQVIMRYVFNAAFSWPEEFCRYCFIYITFLTVGYSIQRQSMLRLNIIVKAIPKKIGDVMEFLIWTSCLVFFSYMLINSVELVSIIKGTERTTPTMGIPYYIIYTSTIIGFGLGIIRNVQFLIKFLHGRIGNGLKKEENV